MTLAAALARLALGTFLALPPWAADLSPDHTRAGELLVLDLDGDGLFLSDRYTPVEFDLDGDGAREVLSWTAAARNEGFLWLDVDRDGVVDSAAELVGTRLRLPDPGAAPVESGFDVLRTLDAAARGGNGDGLLTGADRGWRELRVWVDRNHDGVAGPKEVAGLEDWNLVELRLAHRNERRVDGGLNLHRSVGSFKRLGGLRAGVRQYIQGTITAVSFDVVDGD